MGSIWECSDGTDDTIPCGFSSEPKNNISGVSRFYNDMMNGKGSGGECVGEDPANWNNDCRWPDPKYNGEDVTDPYSYSYKLVCKVP